MIEQREWKPSVRELVRRREDLRRRLAEQQLDGLCLFSPHHVLYLTGSAFIATERPMAVLQVWDREPVLFIPYLEREHAVETTGCTVETYPEYPDREHPMRRLAPLVAARGLRRLGVDSDGYGGGYGYRGPRLSELVKCEVVQVGEAIEEATWIKSPEELEFIRESARWANLAHALLQEYTRPDAVETEVSARASLEASLAMARALGPGYRPTKSGLPAHAGFRGQIGAQSALPHATTTNTRIRAGDVVVTGASADVAGYCSELERTMIVGRPTEKQKRYFGLMLAAQDLALEMIRPGRRCAEVDTAVRDLFQREGIWDAWRHHTGHGLGLRMHEAPFLDVGDETILQPGMVLSVEPGLYIPGFAGFRHSDTLAVTEGGIELLTFYPRALKDLVIA